MHPSINLDVKFNLGSIGVISSNQDPMINLFAAASVGVFLLTSWLAHDYANSIIPFLFLSMICINAFGYYFGLFANKNV